jgi:hypothetical protein
MDDNADGLDIPEFLDRRNWQKRSGYRQTVRNRRRRETAKERRFHQYAVRKAARKRARFEWS